MYLKPDIGTRSGDKDDCNMEQLRLHVHSHVEPI